MNFGNYVHRYENDRDSFSYWVLLFLNNFQYSEKLKFQDVHLQPNKIFRNLFFEKIRHEKSFKLCIRMFGD